MSNINATSLKAGIAFLYEGKPFKVTKYQLIKMGRGGATVRVNCINLENGANIEHAFSSNLSFDLIVNKNKRTMLGVNGRQTVLENNSIVSAVSKLNQIIKSL